MNKSLFKDIVPYTNHLYQGVQYLQVPNIQSHIDETNIKRNQQLLHSPASKINNKKPILAIHGGLGDPKCSVIRLYAESLKALQNQYQLAAIDPFSGNDQSKRIKRCEEIEHSLGIKYNSIYLPSEYFNKMANNVIAQPEAALILTPVPFHAETIINYNQTLGKALKEILFIVEKPSCTLPELSKIYTEKHINNSIEQCANFQNLQEGGFFDFIDRLTNTGNKFYFIDSAMVSHSLNHLLKENLLAKLGNIKKIIAIGVDMPSSLNDKNQDLQDFMLENKTRDIESRGLLNLKKSGGGGFAFDMGIHPLAALSRLLQKQGLNLADAQILEVSPEALSFELRDPGAETYISSKARLADIDLIFEGGKGADIWDRRLEIYTDKATIIVGLGTLKHKNYIFIIPNKDYHREIAPQSLIFEAPDSGYQNHMKDLFDLLNSETKDLNISCQDSLTVMKSAMKFIGKIFNFYGDTTQEREKNIIKVNGAHTNIYLNDAEKGLRTWIESLKNLGGILRKP
jgi:hypothetical protein